MPCATTRKESKTQRRREKNFSQALIARLKAEWSDEQPLTQSRAEQDPWIHMIHGSLGTSKSERLFWVREVVEEVLGWQHGVQFVFFGATKIRWQHNWMALRFTTGLAYRRAQKMVKWNSKQHGIVHKVPIFTLHNHS